MANNRIKQIEDDTVNLEQGQMGIEPDAGKIIYRPTDEAASQDDVEWSNKHDDMEDKAGDGPEYNHLSDAQVELVDGLEFGTYTPTIYNEIFDHATAYIATWSRGGNHISVSGRLDLSPVFGETDGQLQISLPFNPTSTGGGGGMDDEGLEPFVLFKDDNNRYQLHGSSFTDGISTFYYQFTYKAIIS